MARHYPALILTWPAEPGDDDIERLLAELDDERPCAVDETPQGVRVFFSTPIDRDRAAVRLHRTDGVTCEAVDVDDEDWAERSQAAMPPVTIGRIVVAPPWAAGTAAPGEITVVIEPSMGFGTGHHASTRRCLDLLQRLDLDGVNLADVGTGSGVLAIAAWRLGAARVTAVDFDPDALDSARANVERNGATGAVTLVAADLSVESELTLSRFDVVSANLTGALIVRSASTLARLVAPGGHLITSGFQTDEETGVTRALEAWGLVPCDRSVELDWVGATFGHRSSEDRGPLPPPRRPE